MPNKTKELFPKLFKNNKEIVYKIGKPLFGREGIYVSGLQFKGNSIFLKQEDLIIFTYNLELESWFEKQDAKISLEDEQHGERNIEENFLSLLEKIKTPGAKS